MPLIGSPTGLRLIARGPAGIGSCPGPRPSAGRRPPGSPAAETRSAPGSRSCRSRSHTRLPPPAAQRNGPAGPRLPDTTKIPGSTHPRGDSDSPALGTHPRPPCRFWAGSVSGWTFAPPRHPQRSHRRDLDGPVWVAHDPLAVLLPLHKRAFLDTAVRQAQDPLAVGKVRPCSFCRATILPISSRAPWGSLASISRSARNRYRSTWISGGSCAAAVTHPSQTAKTILPITSLAILIPSESLNSTGQAVVSRSLAYLIP